MNNSSVETFTTATLVDNSEDHVGVALIPPVRTTSNSNGGGFEDEEEDAGNDADVSAAAFESTTVATLESTTVTAAADSDAQAIKSTMAMLTATSTMPTTTTTPTTTISTTLAYEPYYPRAAQVKLMEMPNSSDSPRKKANNDARLPQAKRVVYFGEYQVLQTLGEGEFGKVKLARHRATGVEVGISSV